MILLAFALNLSVICSGPAFNTTETFSRSQYAAELAKVKLCGDYNYNSVIPVEPQLTPFEQRVKERRERRINRLFQTV